MGEVNVLRVLDFETTGETGDDSVIEFGYYDLIKRVPKGGVKELWVITPGVEGLVRPTTDMNLEALAVHHITTDVANRGVTWESAQQTIMKGDPQVFVAHNAAFERMFFDRPEIRWIDTYKLALALFPESPKHSNQFLRYYLDVQINPGHSPMPPHRAMPDACVTAYILERILSNTEMSIQAMVELSSKPAQLPRMPFGKHRGEDFQDVPTGYLTWVSNQHDMSEDVLHTTRLELERRRG